MSWTDAAERKLSVESATAESIAAVNAYDIQVNENQSNLDKAKVQLDLARIEYQKWLEGDDHKDRQKNALAIEKTTREKERLERVFLSGVSHELQTPLRSISAGQSPAHVALRQHVSQPLPDLRFVIRTDLESPLLQLWSQDVDVRLNPERNELLPIADAAAVLPFV